jgi:hypothetical protein
MSTVPTVLVTSFSVSGSYFLDKNLVTLMGTNLRVRLQVLGWNFIQIDATDMGLKSDNVIPGPL